MIRRFLSGRGSLWLLMGMDALFLFGLSYALRDRGWTEVIAFWTLATILYFSNNRIWRWIQQAALQPN